MLLYFLFFSSHLFFYFFSVSDLEERNGKREKDTTVEGRKGEAEGFFLINLVEYRKEEVGN